MKIVAAKKLLQANDQIAEKNRQHLASQGVYVVNLVGSPGCGKTTLLEGLLRKFGAGPRLAVIEGDIAGQVDADRIDRMGVPVVQINTDGMCHLDANMIAVACEGVDWRDLDMLVVENIGNLVCTAGYDLGEHLRIAVLSVAEGDDKVVKYPALFQRSDALIITKTDLQPLCDFDSGRVRQDMKRLAPKAEVFQACALQIDSLTAVADWLVDRHREAKATGRII